MLLQPGIKNLRDLLLRLEPARDLQCVFGMPLHPQRERFQPAHGEEAVERTRDRADRVLQELHLISELLVFSDDRDPADDIGVAVQIFRRGMDDHIEPEFDRPLRPGTGEGVIGNTDRVMRTRDFRHRCEIDQFEQRIARRFHPNHARVRLHRGLDRARIRHVDEREIEIRGAAPHFFKKAKSPAIQIVAHDHMRTAIEHIERSRHRSQTRGKSPAAHPAFQIGNATLVGQASRIDRAGIIVALMPARTFLDVGGSLVNRRHDRAGARVG